MRQKKSVILFSYYVIAAWIVVGVYFGITSRWPKILSFQQQVMTLSQFSQKKKNELLVGPVYGAYTALQQTPPNTKILFFIPDINHVAKALLFLYPRSITPVATPSQARQAMQDGTYDYLLIYVATKIKNGQLNMGLVPMNQLQAYWRIDELRDFLAEMKEDPQYSKKDLTDELTANSGILLYKLVE